MKLVYTPALGAGAFGRGGSSPLLGTMIKAILFDVDGVIIHSDEYFSKRLSREKNIPYEEYLAFFENEYKACVTGKASATKELEAYLDRWGWEGGAEELLQYWFDHENDIDEELLGFVDSLRAKGVECFVSTNNIIERVNHIMNEQVGGHFDGFFASSIVGYTKDKEAFWIDVYKHFPDHKKDEILVIDNDELNISAAKAFGFNTIFFPGREELIKQINNKI